MKIKSVCSDKKDVERYLARQAVEWDGKAMLYSDVADCYFYSIEEAEEYAFEAQLSLADLRIRICEPVYARRIEVDDFCDDLPEDDSNVPDELYKAISDFNEAVRGVLLSWKPGKCRLKIDEN